MNKLILSLLKNGIRLPILNDIPKNVPSITYSMVYMSGLLALLSCSEKASEFLGKLDSDTCLNLFIAASVLYLGRGVLRSKNGQILTSEEKNDTEVP